MKKTDYIPNDNFEVSVFITMTEFCHKRASVRGFNNLNAWGEYYRNQIVGNSNLGPISKELSVLYASLSRMYALTVTEISTFIILYFKHYIWLDYEPLLNARKQYTGDFY